MNNLENAKFFGKEITKKYCQGYPDLWQICMIWKCNFILKDLKKITFGPHFSKYLVHHQIIHVLDQKLGVNTLRISMTRCPPDC